MPYTAKEDRNHELPRLVPAAPANLAQAIIEWLNNSWHLTDGERVWGVCTLMSQYAAAHPRCFDTWFDVLYSIRLAEKKLESTTDLAIIDCCRMEFYRRVVAPYEDLKAKANGEVWDRTILPLDGQYA